jgi:uncharacterized protein (DUF362 family)/NAD-dependent dihydropyrimidine dehydrogenase PreA subunit
VSQVLIHKATYADYRQAVEEAFRLFPLEIEGRKVLIKPNALRAAAPEEHIATHPALLRAVVEKVEEMRPASITVGDNPGVFSYGQNEFCFQKTGLMEAAKGYYRNIGNEAVSLTFHSEYLPQVSVSRAVMEAEVVISLPKFKTHGLTVITGAIKNSYGILPGAQKAKLHRAAGTPERFHEVIVEVFRLRVPDLFLVDAVVGMEGNGPASPDLREIGLILASDNAVALDAVIAMMMGCDPGRLRFLQKAKEAGLGDYALNGIDIIGKLEALPDFKLPPLGGEASTANPAVQAFLESRTRLRPQADPDRCTACGTCVDQCPVQALSLEADLPVVDPDLCITCFCCQEMCPEKAITLR